MGLMKIRKSRRSPGIFARLEVDNNFHLKQAFHVCKPTIKSMFYLKYFIWSNLF